MRADDGFLATKPQMNIFIKILVLNKYYRLGSKVVEDFLLDCSYFLPRYYLA